MRSGAKHLGTIAISEILLLSFCGSCSIFQSEPPPRAYFALPAARRTQIVQLAACTDSTSSDDTVVPVLVAIANGSQTAWTVDASQISAAIADDAGQGSVFTAEEPKQKWLPIPPEEAARMAPVSITDGWAALFDRAGIVATYFAGLGAAGGAFAANEKGESVDNGFDLGAAWGAVIGGVVGTGFEYFRLTYSHETKEAGDANEKMKFLALRDRTTLYTDYSALGYVYFLPNVKEGADSTHKTEVTIPLVRGDPSKDWVSPPTYNFPDHPGEAECERRRVECENKPASSKDECRKDAKDCEEKGLPPVSSDRYGEFDQSPVVCDCKVELSACDNTMKDSVVVCSAAGGRGADSCTKTKIDNGIFILDATHKLGTSTVWRKNHLLPGF
jgi:hypothetical protein